MNVTHSMAKQLLLATLAAGLAACTGPQGPTGAQGVAGEPCRVTANADGSATVRCPDGSQTVITGGLPGQNGKDGLDGSNGTSCSISSNPDAGTKTISCTDGTSVVLRDGSNGNNGINGVSGLGPDGGIATRLTNFHGTAALERIALNSTGKFIARASISSASADVAGTVVVNFSVKDTADGGISGLKTFSFNVAKLNPPPAGEASTRWVPYIQRIQVVADAGVVYPNPPGTAANQGNSEANGTLVDLGSGSYTYTFFNKLGTTKVPTDAGIISYDRSVPHRVSVMFGGGSGPTGTATLDFVPDGSASTLSRAIVSTTTCKQCHGEEFQAHAGNRRSVENCDTCHAPGMIDPQSGNTLDMKVMIHKIHAGGDLPSVAGPDGITWDDPATPVNEAADNGSYAIWGFQDLKQEWWKVGFPAEIANCTKCHQGTTAEVDNWKNVPSRAACGSCHDDVDFATGTNHPGGAAANDNACSTCHPATGNIVAPAIYPIPVVHDFMNNDPRNVQEFDATLTMTGYTGGRSYFVAGDVPVVHLVLKENGVALDHTTLVADDATTVVPAGDGPEGCLTTGCPPRDGKLTSANLFVHGPRAVRNPVLTTKARAFIKSPGTVVFPLNLSNRVTTAGLTTETSSLILKMDGNEDLLTVDATGQDFVIAANVTVPLVTIGFSGRVTSAASLTSLTDAQQTTWRNHQWAGYTFQVTSGTAKNQEALVLDNVGGVLTLAAGLTTQPDGTSLYRLNAVTGAAGGIVTAVPSTTTVTDATRAWVDKQWAGFTFKIISGLGAGQSALVTTNVGNTLTLASALATQPDATSVYHLTPFASSPATATQPEIITWLNAFPAFKGRAIAYAEGNSVSLRSRNLGRFFAIQLQASFVATQLYAGDLTEKVIGGFTVGNLLAKQTDPLKNDPKTAWAPGEITYTLDPVDDLKPGTYLANIELADRGAKSAADYKTPTVARITFQVGTATEEKPAANNCGQCHTDPTDTKGLVVDYMRHNKLLNNTAVDLCGACHDYQPQGPVLEWSGAQPISRRVHGVHFGSNLNFPAATIGHTDTDPGRNWDITFPQSVRNCDTTCHGPTTSGTWKTKPARLPCSGCHDSLAAKSHMKAMTFDPTPNDPWSGDEGEACKVCH